MANREMRRLQAKEEERAKKRRQEKARPQKKRQRTSLLQFLREVRQELKKVVWPSREELTTYSIVVFATTTVLTLVIFGMDWVFGNGVIRLLDFAT